MAPKKTGRSRKSSQNGKSKAVSNSTRAGTIFPVGRCNRYLKQGRYADRISGSAGVFMAGVLEYITAELLELAGNVCEERKMKTIQNSHINLGVRNDEELAKLMSMTTMHKGGQAVFVHDFLKPAKKGKGVEASQAM
jgi:histone H2A